MSPELVAIAGDGDEGRSARVALERCVSSGGVAVFPADGVYGICCDPIDQGAIDRVHRIKGRDEGKSSAILYFSALSMRELVSGLTPRVAEAVGRLLPGPVTLILPNPDQRYPLACREDPGRLGVRLLDGPLEGMPLPLFQTSANLSGAPAVARFEELDPEVIDGVDLVIDGGDLQGKPSTVVDLTGFEQSGGFEVLREGAVSAARVQETLGISSGKRNDG